jgi:hypothetical protein
MLGGAPLGKSLAVAGLELTVLVGTATLIRVLSAFLIAGLVVLAFRHRRHGLDW